MSYVDDIAILCIVVLIVCQMLLVLQLVMVYVVAERGHLLPEMQFVV